jgi:hypothetical protein
VDALSKAVWPRTAVFLVALWLSRRVLCTGAPSDVVRRARDVSRDAEYYRAVRYRLIPGLW